MARISIPTTARLPSSLRVAPSNPAVSKILNHLSRGSLLSIVLDWLDENNQALAAPYLRAAEDEDDGLDDLNPPAQSLEELQELYADLQARKGSKREVLDRIVEGDWRHGLSLYQLAMADLQYLYDHPLSQKWSAYRIMPLKPAARDGGGDEHTPPLVDNESLMVPRFHPSTFLNALQAQVLPDVKAHYNFDRHRSLPLLLLRIFILDSPYNTSLGIAAPKPAPTTFDTSRTVYIAFPDASPHVFISKPQTVGASAAAGESKSLRTLIVEGIPKALSRPRRRFTLKSTSLATRNLEEMVERRGAQRTNSAAGGWGVYADETKKESPLDTVLPTPPLSEEEEGGGERKRKKRARALSPAARREERAVKRARLVAKARFGESARVDDGKGVERVDVVIEDAFPEDEPTGKSGRRERLRDGEREGEGEEEEDDDSQWQRRSKGGRRSRADIDLEREREIEADRQREAEGGQWRPNVRLTFRGSHVFAGLRQLVEHGIIDGERMPGWLTGEEGVTVGAVRNGRIRGYKGSGV
ncbi:centromere protein Chl4/mis15/CENP-N [Lasiosphaeria hispida]|uniref:Centromere protein Chl4/mis15/CENP-N n=1 Tax=Lasiosphaeria hispida TaxID=260671 RepID=A0AAJ0HA81_9PEZI|nr:centromere protein Chl4/mis15/CENP-N [Lasiosphaeria hispida]